MKSRSLNFKVAFMIGLLSCGALVITYLGINRMSDINTTFVDFAKLDVKRDQLTSTVLDEQRQASSTMKDIIIERDPRKMEKLQEKFDGHKSALFKNLDEYHSMASPEGKALASKYKDAANNWFGTANKIITLSRANKDVEVVQVRENEELPLLTNMRAAIKDMNDLTAKRIDDSVRSAGESYITAKNLMMTISLSCIFVCVALAFVVMRQMSTAIRNVITDLTGGSEQVAAASTQIASSAVQLSEASTEQASSLEETVATLEELTSMVKVNSEHAKEAARLSESTRSIAGKGEEEIKQLIASMSEISKDSRKIEEIINVIDDIAFQTNLLALNAAVEAARAGEQGKGFAVVAEAVRALAQRSSSAAKDINDLIKSSVEKIEKGSVQAGQSGKVLEDILNSVKKVSDINAEIATASNEQTNGIQQISTAMNQLDQVTQVNAASSEEAAAAAEELSAQGVQLIRAMGVLNVTVYGGPAPESEPSVHAAPKASTSHKSGKSAKPFANNVIPMNAKEEEEALSDKRTIRTTSGF
ncbi:methyl-accepting chemotaxis protein [Bdellovibrio sp. HCB209]|uniref:HAMP domain-containing methyl-accepting chemotaxis protein n=1 Tax=Bdellovibrio sp. HCB209 TaxID=3394354 RepID=UPI0039B4F163